MVALSQIKKGVSLPTGKRNAEWAAPRPIPKIVGFRQCRSVNLPIVMSGLSTLQPTTSYN